MGLSEPTTFFWILVAVHFSGLVGAIIARASEGCCGHPVCLFLFLACLFVVGLTTMALLQVASGMGLLSAFTLGAMILATTCDFQQATRTQVR